MQTFKNSFDFNRALENHLGDFGGSIWKFTSDKHGLGCIRCKEASSFGACGNCENGIFQLVLSTENVVGLFCQKCRRGYTSWTCKNCGTENPIAHETIYVATAAYGSPLAIEVMALSQFRDHVLLRSKPGALFVTTYYRVSPLLAAVIVRHQLLRAATRKFFLSPVLLLIKAMKFNE